MAGNSSLENLILQTFVYLRHHNTLDITEVAKGAIKTTDLINIMYYPFHWDHTCTYHLRDNHVESIDRM